MSDPLPILSSHGVSFAAGGRRLVVGLRRILRLDRLIAELVLRVARGVESGRLVTHGRVGVRAVGHLCPVGHFGSRLFNRGLHRFGQILVGRPLRLLVLGPGLGRFGRSVLGRHIGRRLGLGGCRGRVRHLDVGALLAHGHRELGALCGDRSAGRALTPLPPGLERHSTRSTRSPCTDPGRAELMARFKSA